MCLPFPNPVSNLNSHFHDWEAMISSVVFPIYIFSLSSFLRLLELWSVSEC